MGGAGSRSSGGEGGRAVATLLCLGQNIQDCQTAGRADRLTTSLLCVAPRWRWLFVILGFVVLSCCAPGTMVNQLGREVSTASMATPIKAPPVSECMASSCNHGSSPSVPIPALSVAGLMAGGILVLLALSAARRVRSAPAPLPVGSRARLFRPPQTLASA
jgi:hypothetical protein